MKNAEDGERGIEYDNHLKQVDESFLLLKLAEETEYSVKSKENRHERSRIPSDHFDFLILPVEIPDAHIIQSPDRGQKQRDEDRNPCNDQESPELKLPCGNQ